MSKRSLLTKVTLWLMEAPCYVLHRSRWWNPFWHNTLIGSCFLNWLFHQWPKVEVWYYNQMMLEAEPVAIKPWDKDVPR